MSQITRKIFLFRKKSELSEIRGIENFLYAFHLIKSLGWKQFVLHEKKLKFSEEYFFSIFAAILKLIYVWNG